MTTISAFPRFKDLVHSLAPCIMKLVKRCDKGSGELIFDLLVVRSLLHKVEDVLAEGFLGEGES